MISGFVPAIRRVCLGLVIITGAALCPCEASTLSWSNPQGTISLFGDGGLATVLDTEVLLADVEASDSLKYLDSATLPAVSRAEAFKGEMSFAATAQLSVSESQESGLPFAQGRIDFSSLGGASGTGGGAITLYYLISLVGPAQITFRDVRSAISTSASPESAFSLALFESDASGARLAGAVLSFTGEQSDANGSYEADAPFYLVEMKASAYATPATADSISFSYFVHLSPVPEPGGLALLMAGGLSIALVLGVRRAGRRKAGWTSPGEE